MSGLPAFLLQLLICLLALDSVQVKEKKNGTRTLLTVPDDVSGSGSMDLQGSRVMNLTPLMLHESHGLFYTSLSHNTSKRGSHISWISTSHTSHSRWFESRLSQGVSYKLHLGERRCSRDRSRGGMNPYGAAVRADEQERALEHTLVVQRWGLLERARCRHSVSSALYIQSIHPGVRDKGTVHIWFRHSPARPLKWGMSTEAVGTTAGKPDMSSSILDARIT